MSRPTPLRILSPLHRASRQIALHLETRMGGRPAVEGHLLSYLRGHAPCAVGELVRVFGIKGATLTGRLDRMEARGLVERRIHPQDRRSFLVHLTDAGQREARDLDQLVRRFERAVLDGLDERDLEGFRAVLEAIENETRVVVRPATSPGQGKTNDRRTIP